MREFTVKVKPLTPIWTGDTTGKNTTLRETGIIGSLRWWYEALVRGLGGTACDPTYNKCKDENHCDACELFGCTDWARKFRLEVEKTNSEVTLRFIELRNLKDVEWALLNKTLKIIADYGAMGGKISEDKYGLIKIEHNDLEGFTLERTQIEDYLKKRRDTAENPNIVRFVFINYNLKYETVKKLKDKLPFLKGQKGEGKRYFYKTLNGSPYRLFAYGKNNKEYNEIITFLNENSVQFVEDKEILEGLK